VPYNEGTDAVELKIINGYNVTNSEFDFMVALFQQVPGRQPRFFCGGVLLDNATVLTGAPGLSPAAYDA
jgi:secreted trypsin-like serine protease